MLLSECALAVNGKLVGNDVAFSSVSIDTRALQPGQLYIAIKGKNFDGNEFVAQAEQAGAGAAIVHAGFPCHVPHVIVEDTHAALGKLAGAWRDKHKASQNGQPAVIGMTGSNGKTTVKEMVAAILAVNDTVLSTKGNLNNDIGVPLTLLRLTEAHRYAVIEMGANHIGEIAYTSQYAKADAVIITNVSAAHIEGFGSLDGVAKAKGEIIETLKADGVAVINHDDTYFDYWKNVAGQRKVVAFGLNKSANVTASNIKTTVINNEFFTTFSMTTPAGNIEGSLKLAGQHNVVNALAATAACLSIGIPLSQIQQGLATIKPVTGRLQPLVGRLGNRIIDDTYNANPASLKAGLDVLTGLEGEPWLVLGAFGELGETSPDIHSELGQIIKAKGVSKLLAVGSDTSHTVKSFGQGARFFQNQDDLIATLKQELTGKETILVKGSRSQRMENVVAALVDNFRI
jgi:UDP-N-acetylmuramoyl-tripeptide--D-alanyl-D-alanine ligase